MSLLLSQGDARHIPLRDESVQCVVTSPPYWGLRDYGLNGRGIGLEASPDEYVAQLVAVFREVWRVLRDDGVAWLNLGDSYTSGGRNGHGTRVGYKQQTNRGMCGENDPVRPLQPLSLKPKDLVGIPWRVALALQADGWWLRSDIIWHKPNPMPESVTDRPTKAHEYVFLLAKSKRYYYDAEAVRETSSWDPSKTKMPDGWDTGTGSHRTIHRNGREKGRANCASVSVGRNKRSVWTITTQPYRGAHFATFPVKLVEPMVLAGTSAKGCCPQCQKPWERVVERVGETTTQRTAALGHSDKRGAGGRLVTQNLDYAGGHGSNTRKIITVGWRPGCDCYDLDYRRDFPQARSARKRYQRRVTGDWWERVRKRPGKTSWPVEPCITLDPFGGTMTVGQVCAKHGRDFVGLDLKREYVEMGRARCSDVQMAMGL